MRNPATKGNVHFAAITQSTFDAQERFSPCKSHPPAAMRQSKQATGTLATRRTPHWAASIAARRRGGQQREVGEPMGRLFDDNTWMGDGQCRRAGFFLRLWEHEHPPPWDPKIGPAFPKKNQKIRGLRRNPHPGLRHRTSPWGGGYQVKRSLPQRGVSRAGHALPSSAIGRGFHTLGYVSF